MNMQTGGSQFSIESLMTPNFVFFVTTIAVIGYLYHTRTILGRESEVKSESSNLFDKQMYLELGFMILIGFCVYIFNCNDNTTFVWIYILAPIVYLMIKGLLVFNKVTGYLEKAPEHTDLGSDVADIIKANKNVGQVPVTNQDSHAVQITSALNQALGVNNNMNPPLNTTQRNNNIMSSQSPMQPLQPPSPEGFSLF